MIEWEELPQKDDRGYNWVLHRAFVACADDDGPLDLRIVDDGESAFSWEIIRFDFGDVRRGEAGSLHAAKMRAEECVPAVLKEIAAERPVQRRAEMERFKTDFAEMLKKIGAPGDYGYNTDAGKIAHMLHQFRAKYWALLKTADGHPKQGECDG
ncbi:hypothetical protein [Hoeflea poritis]|uniref:Uncharacterized protein n=1 Tax=Hoeflea poritis TaxID=2993659 RepID=A0ABT4VMP4_9HYPH|nr:hypothetical protein [Hoeflea poritis]MDA4845991.1 hypothetical protein [Hoeflea poritis]